MRVWRRASRVREARRAGAAGRSTASVSGRGRSRSPARSRTATSASSSWRCCSRPTRDVILLDEPMAGVSVEDVPALVELIRAVQREEGKTVLMVEHHIEVVTGRRRADRGHAPRRACSPATRPTAIMANEDRAGGLPRGSRCDRGRRSEPLLASRTCTSTSASRTCCRASRSTSRGRRHRAARPERCRQDDDAPGALGLVRAARERHARRRGAHDGCRRTAIVRRGVGYVPEDRDIFAGLTVEENLGSPSANGAPRYDLVYELFPELSERGRAARRHALGRPAADGRDRAGAAEREPDAARRRADEGARAAARRPRWRDVLERVSETETMLLVEQNLGVVRADRPRRDRARPGPRRLRGPGEGAARRPRARAQRCSASPTGGH